MHTDINASGFDFRSAVAMCGATARPGETELDALRRDRDGQRALRINLAHQCVLYQAAAETAAKTIKALRLALEHQLPEHRAEDIWNALTAKADTEGAMHRDDMIAVLRGLGFK